jgi:multidrug resistance efflux pump
MVRQGQLLAELAAPELQARLAEAEYRVQAAESERLQAEAQPGRPDHAGTSQESRGAPGHAGIELLEAVEAAQALVRARQQAGRAGEAAARHEDMEAYLRIAAL